jgi:hypothetical protein
VFAQTFAIDIKFLKCQEQNAPSVRLPKESSNQESSEINNGFIARIATIILHCCMKARSKRAKPKKTTDPHR